MDKDEGEELKMKSPKFMKVETNDPEVAEELLEKASEKEDSMEVPEEKPEMMEMPEEEEDEDEKRLRELYSKLK